MAGAGQPGADRLKRAVAFKEELEDAGRAGRRIDLPDRAGPGIRAPHAGHPALVVRGAVQAEG